MYSVTKYISVDGIEFDSKAACLAHEEEYVERDFAKKLFMNSILYDEDFDPLYIGERTVNDYAIYYRRASFLQNITKINPAISEWMHNKYGINLPTQKGIYKLNDDNEVTDCFETEVLAFKKKWPFVKTVTLRG